MLARTSTPSAKHETNIENIEINSFFFISNFVIKLSKHENSKTLIISDLIIQVMIFIFFIHYNNKTENVVESVNQQLYYQPLILFTERPLSYQS